MKGSISVVHTSTVADTSAPECIVITGDVPLRNTFNARVYGYTEAKINYRYWARARYRAYKEFRQIFNDMAERVLAGEHLKILSIHAPHPCHGQIIQAIVLNLVKRKEK